MDPMPPRESDFGVDLEAGETTKLCRGFESADGSVKGENGVSPEKVNLLIVKKVEGEEAADLAENKTGKEKRKKTSAKKPPRPPRSLSLDAADQKLIKEIAELTMMKRARIERMKAVKKMKAAKSSSSSGTVFAMLFTVVFCLVILFQGVSSRSSTVSLQGSPESARATGDGFVLDANARNPSASDTYLLGIGTPNLVKQVPGSEPENTGS